MGPGGLRLRQGGGRRGVHPAQERHGEGDLAGDAVADGTLAGLPSQRRHQRARRGGGAVRLHLDDPPGWRVAVDHDHVAQRHHLRGRPEPQRHRPRPHHPAADRALSHGAGERQPLADPDGQPALPRRLPAGVGSHRADPGGRRQPRARRRQQPPAGRTHPGGRASTGRGHHRHVAGQGRRGEPRRRHPREPDLLLRHLHLRRRRSGHADERLLRSAAQEPPSRHPGEHQLRPQPAGGHRPPAQPAPEPGLRGHQPGLAGPGAAPDAARAHRVPRHGRQGHQRAPARPDADVRRHEHEQRLRGGVHARHDRGRWPPRLHQRPPLPAREVLQPQRREHQQRRLRGLRDEPVAADRRHLLQPRHLPRHQPAGRHPAVEPLSGDLQQPPLHVGRRRLDGRRGLGRPGR